jgi:acetylornithine deacetylase/succinyl-diaminopimelate desuccinylase-like protein
MFWRRLLRICQMSDCSQDVTTVGPACDRPVPEFARLARTQGFRRYLQNLLWELCAIDTTPKADVRAAAREESRVFDVIEREIAACGFNHAELVRRPIDPRIADHAFFSPPYYTQTPGTPAGLDVRQCYCGRSNLVFAVDGEQRTDSGVNQAINVHVDVVAPYAAPSLEGDSVWGRGTCDDKGNVVALLGALKLLSAHLEQQGGRLNRHLTAMFVIDEETGGNGSLSCAIDPALKKRYDSLLVLECTGGHLHPGNRGCVWYQVAGELPGVDLFEAASFIVAELELEGRAIKAESDHALFSHRPVQTCHGIIGNSGTHPSRVNADVSFRIDFDRGGDGTKAVGLIRDAMENGLCEYVGLYGDRTQVTKPADGKPLLERHYELSTDDRGLAVRVWGLSGHMGSIQDCDGAITKMAAMVRALVRSRTALERAAGSPLGLNLEGWPDAQRLHMEGGQGFLPTHSLDEVERRLREAVWRGVRYYFGLIGCKADATKVVRVRYDKLRNAAFAREPNSPDVLNAVKAAKAAGLWNSAPIRGWDASCDARIFACEYPTMPVITAGAGALEYAHSDRERIDISDVARVAEFLTHFILRQTGTA